MAELARLSDEGRVEALRELRDHYHVFAFAEGTRPAESLIRETLGAKPEPKKRGEEEKKPSRKEAAARKGATAKAKSQPKARAGARRKR